MSITPPLFSFTDDDGDRLQVRPTPNPDIYHLVIDCTSTPRPIRIVAMTMRQMSDFADAIRAVEYRGGRPAESIPDPCPFADL